MKDYINKNLLIFTLLSFTCNSYAASSPAQVFSRANCFASIPTQGTGYFNESVSYEADLNIGNNTNTIFIKHFEMEVTTFQRNNCNNNVRGGTPVFNPVGHRVRAGYIDPLTLTTNLKWVVEGIHKETLDNRTIVTMYSSASDCNLVINQFL